MTEGASGLPQAVGSLSPSRGSIRRHALSVGVPLVGTAFYTLAGTGLAPLVGHLAPSLAGFAAAAVLLLFLAPRMPGQARAEAACVVLLTTFVSFPITRVAGVSSRQLLIFIAISVAVAAIGMIGTHAQNARGRFALCVLFIVLATGSAIFGSKGGLLLLACFSLVPGATSFLLAQALSREGLRRVSVAIVSMACIQAALALVEPVVFPFHLWAAAATDAAGNVAPLMNALLGAGRERSQASMAHPLPLGFLLVVGIALVLRTTVPRRSGQIWVLALLSGGLVMSGSRNSLILVAGLLLFFGARRTRTPKLVLVAAASVAGLLIALMAGIFDSAAINTFAASGSYTHRLAAYSAFGELLSRQSLFPAVIGNGYGSIPRLFREGLLQTDGFNVVDNQLVLMLAQGGVLAFVTFTGLCVLAVRAGDWRWRGAVVVVVANSLIFDWFSWPSCVSVGLFCVGAALGGRRGRDINEELMDDGQRRALPEPATAVLRSR